MWSGGVYEPSNPGVMLLQRLQLSAQGACFAGAQRCRPAGSDRRPSAAMPCSSPHAPVAACELPCSAVGSSGQLLARANEAPRFELLAASVGESHTRIQRGRSPAPAPEAASARFSRGSGAPTLECWIRHFFLFPELCHSELSC